MQKLYGFLEVFQLVVHGINLYRNKEDAIKAWEAYTECSYNEYVSDRESIEEDYELCDIYELDSPDITCTQYIFVGDFQDNIDPVELYTDEKKAEQRWEEFTGHSYAEYCKDDESLSIDYVGTKVFIIDADKIHDSFAPDDN